MHQLTLANLQWTGLPKSTWKGHLLGTLMHWSVLGGREINWAPQLCVYDVADAVEIEDDFGRRRLRMREEAEVVYRDWISAFLIPPWWIDKTDRVGKMGWMHVVCYIYDMFECSTTRSLCGLWPLDPYIYRMDSGAQILVAFSGIKSVVITDRWTDRHCQTGPFLC